MTYTPEEQKASVLRDGVARRTLSFYKYVRFEDQAIRHELMARWGALGLGHLQLRRVSMHR